MLVTELSYPTYRAPMTSLYNSLWYSGSIMCVSVLSSPAIACNIDNHMAISAAWTTFGTQHIPSDWSWRVPSLLQGLPAVLQVFLVFLMPESPRWLVSKGRDEQALRTLAYYHADGNE